jgi:diadenosine tetraphosphate (Ap4A) HIT family hydrolase
MTEKECTFCGVVRGEINSEIILRRDGLMVVMAQPPTPLGHAIVIPEHHAMNFSDLSVEEQINFAVTWGLVEQALVTLLKKPRAVNLKSGGFVPGHFHLHIYEVERETSWDDIIGMFENRVASGPEKSERQKLIKQLREQLGYKT